MYKENLNILDKILKEWKNRIYLTPVSYFCESLVPGWANGGTGITKISEPWRLERYKQVVEAYGNSGIWIQNDALHSIYTNLSDFWEFEQNWQADSPYVPLSEKVGGLAVTINRNFGTPFRYGSTVKILEVRGDGWIKVETVSDVPVEGMFTERELWWENKDNND